METTDNVSSHYIERYDTNRDLEDENYAKHAKISQIQNQRFLCTSLRQFGRVENHHTYPESYESSNSDTGAHSYKNYKQYFERIFIKRDNVNNVGNLICFPLDTDRIMIVGGLNIGLLSGKSHVFDAKQRKVNCSKELEMPIPDISKFFYKYR